MERLTKRENENVMLSDYTYEEMKDKFLDHANDVIDCVNLETALEKLADYEDKEEQGLLKILPCGIGADVYIIPSETNFRLNLLHGHGELNRVYHQKVYSITFTNNGWYMEGDKEHEYGTCRLLLDRFFKETWFLTEAEAESALAKMGGK